jgi:hypothetical protein
MKKLRGQRDEQKRSASSRKTIQKEGDGEDDGRARRASDGGDLMWGDEGIDDPPVSSG